MSLLKNLLGKKQEPIKNYSDFWKWFQQNEHDFYKAVKSGKNIEKNFFEKLSPKLAELKDGYFYLTGMYDDSTVELVFTAEGDAKNIAFVEELVDAAPEVQGWKFTSLKPALKIEDVNIEMEGHRFDAFNLFFYSNDLPDYPDEIDICVVHEDYNEENKQQIISGIYIFLDNFLGELEFLNNIDSLHFEGKSVAKKELIPIAKLKEFLKWRQKEFLEKYEGLRYDTDNDEYSVMEAELQSGNKLIATLNVHLLDWDRKASHPWFAVMTIKYDGNNNNGLPNTSDYETLNIIEDDIRKELVDKDGYLNIGRQTAKNEREIYFACKDFRKPSKVLYQIKNKYADQFEIEYDIYKDKYWQTMNRFKQS